MNVNKCKFAVLQLTFFSHVIDEHGIAPVPERVAAIQHFPQPTSLWQLQRYLALINGFFQVALNS